VESAYKRDSLCAAGVVAATKEMVSSRRCTRRTERLKFLALLSRSDARSPEDVYRYLGATHMSYSFAGWKPERSPAELRVPPRSKTDGEMFMLETSNDKGDRLNEQSPGWCRCRRKSREGGDGVGA